MAEKRSSEGRGEADTGAGEEHRGADPGRADAVARVAAAAVTGDPSRPEKLVSLETDGPFWDRFFGIFPLVVVGTREGGHYDLAPKHMSMPLGWSGHFGFVCTPAHATFRNARREGSFTVSYPRPTQVVVASLTASPRQGPGGRKYALDSLPTFPAREVDGVLMRHAYAHLECELERTVDGFGDASLVVGRIVAAHAHQDILRESEVEDAELLRKAPLLAYVAPGRFAAVADTHPFPFPAGFMR